MIILEPVCDKNCFQCSYDDCIYDGLDQEDYQEEKQIDISLGLTKNKKSEAALKANRRYYQKNKEKILTRQKQYWTKNKSKIAEQQHRYYQDNKEKILARNKRYREKNRESIRAYNKARYQKMKAQKEGTI